MVAKTVGQPLVGSPFMARLRCTCGATLNDSSDFLSYKGHIVADQDLEDVADDGDAEGTYGAILRQSRMVFQCGSCGRLILGLAGGWQFFSADDPERSRKVLGSIHGESWKRHLRASWSDDEGSIWWGFGVEDEGAASGIRSWDELAAQYYEVFERLRSRDLLRDSLLERDDAYVHEWP